MDRLQRVSCCPYAAVSRDWVIVVEVVQLGYTYTRE